MKIQALHVSGLISDLNPETQSPAPGRFQKWFSSENKKINQMKYLV